MSKSHYLMRRSRSGRFNFTLLSDSGRLNGSVVVVLDGRTSDEVKQEAQDQIRKLAIEFVGRIGSDEFGMTDEAMATPPA